MQTQEFLKGTLKTLILSILEEQGEMYGYEITQTVKSKSLEDLELTEGALYPTLHKLQDQKLLVAHNKVVGGRTRKYYQLTDLGLREAQKAKYNWFRFLEVMNKLIKPLNYA